ncbi:MAG: YdbL family protein [Novosphingobium sp.]
MRNTASLAIIAGAVLAAPAIGQARDPAYEAARAAGQVGEQVDGYLGFPSSPTAEVRRVADAVNITRRKIYTDRAVAKHQTVEEYAFTSGCLLISKTKPGEKYQTPDGTWHTRTAEAPVRDPKCTATDGASA